MGRQLRTFVFCSLVGLSATSLAASPTAEEPRDTVGSQAPVAVQRAVVPATGIRDEVAMVMVGTMLIGLASAVRRAA